MSSHDLVLLCIDPLQSLQALGIDSRTDFEIVLSSRADQIAIASARYAVARNTPTTSTRCWPLQSAGLNIIPASSRRISTLVFPHD